MCVPPWSPGRGNEEGRGSDPPQKRRDTERWAGLGGQRPRCRVWERAWREWTLWQDEWPSREAAVFRTRNAGPSVVRGQPLVLWLQFPRGVRPRQGQDSCIHGPWTIPHPPAVPSPSQHARRSRQLPQSGHGPETDELRWSQLTGSLCCSPVCPNTP